MVFLFYPSPPSTQMYCLNDEKLEIGKQKNERFHTFFFNQKLEHFWLFLFLVLFESFLSLPQWMIENKKQTKKAPLKQIRFSKTNKNERLSLRSKTPHIFSSTFFFFFGFFAPFFCFPKSLIVLLKILVFVVPSGHSLRVSVLFLVGVE